MFLINILLIVLWFLLVPILIGSLFTKYMKTDKNSIALSLICGYAGMFTIFEIVMLPMIYLKATFEILVWILGGLLLIISAVSCILNATRVKKVWKNFFWEFPRQHFTLYLAIFIIVFQVLVCTISMHLDYDDAFYVGTSSTTIQTNSLYQYDPYTGNAYQEFPARYVLSPYPIYISMMSKLILMHPATVAHTVMPAIFIPLVYSLIALIGKKILPDNKKAFGIFMLIVAVVQIFSYYSVYTASTFILLRIWQGKALLANLFLPGIFYFVIRTMGDKGKSVEWIVLFCMVSASAFVSSMGIMLAPIMMGILSLIYSIYRKKLRYILQGLLCCSISIITAALYLIIR